MSYTRMRFTVFLSIFIYFGAALVTRITIGVNEMYPFNSWWLFSEIPSERHTFTINILSIGTTTYDPPLAFSEAGFLFRALVQSPTQYIPYIRQLGMAVMAEDVESISQQRSKLEKIFRGQHASYEVLQISYDPLEYWETNEYREKRTIATYEVN